MPTTSTPSDAARRSPRSPSRTSFGISNDVASYSVLIKKSAAKELEAAPKKDREKLVTRIQALADSPRPPGSEKLAGDDRYRIRFGMNRVLYEIDDAIVMVTGVRVAHRRELYK